MAPYIIVKDAKKAIEFYKKAFNAKEVHSMPGPDGKIMHCEMRIGDEVLMLADEFPQVGCVSPEALKGSPVTIFMYVQDVDKAFDQATKAGAKVTMPVADMFWGDRYGHFEDPFGHKWALATHKEDLTDAEVEKRHKEWEKTQMAGAHK